MVFLLSLLQGFTDSSRQSRANRSNQREQSKAQQQPNGPNRSEPLSSPPACEFSSFLQNSASLQLDLHRGLELDVACTMLNSLLFENYMDMQDKEVEPESSQTSEELDPKPSLESEIEPDVQCWSVEDVLTWLRKHVPLEKERIEECIRAFQSEGIDGLRLLALQRNNRACSGISDSEWLLLYSARENLLVANDRRSDKPPESHSSSPFSSPRSTKENTLEQSALKEHEPYRLHTSKSLIVRPTRRKSGLVKSSLRFLSLNSTRWWTPPTTKLEQKESSAAEVSSLQEEILSAEEREAALKAKVDHLDGILRTAQLASYLYTRMRWTPLPGEPPVDDVDVDDWLQRFVVLEGSTLFYYPQAADLRPQGAILFSEIVDAGAISGNLQYEEENITWFGFHITTCEGLRLECATPIKMQADLWISLIQAARTDQRTPEPDKGTHADLLE